MSQSATAPANNPSTKPNPLPLESTLRDLALIRAFDIDQDLASILASTPQPVSTASQSQPSADEAVESSVARSYEFAKAARGAIRLEGRGDVEKQGERVELIRAGLEEVKAVLEQRREADEDKGLQ